MKILADENVEAPIVRRLRSDGHEITYIVETHPGVEDTEILQIAVSLQVILLSDDKDFGDLIFFHHLQPPIGIILIRLSAHLSISVKSDIISDVLQSYEERLIGAFTVISDSGVRIRDLP